MKKTQLIETIKNIKGSLISYIAIAVFVMLGVALFTGMTWASSSLSKNVEELSVNEGAIHDVEIFFPYGLSDEDLKVLNEVDGVDQIEGSRFCYGFFRTSENAYQSIIHELPSDIDIFIDTKGTLPSKENEIAIDRKWASEHNVNIGDTLTFIKDDDGTARNLVTLMNYDASLDEIPDLIDKDEIGKPKKMSYLNTDIYTVTALVTSPVYTYRTYGASPSNDIALDVNMYVCKDAWAKDSDVGYTDIRIRSNSLRNYGIFSDEYDEISDELISRLSDKLSSVAANRNNTLSDNIDSLLSETDRKLSEANKDIEKALSDLKAGRIELDDAKKEIEEARKKIEESKITLQDAYNTLIKNQTLADNAEKELSDAYKLLSEKQKLADESEAALKDAEELVENIQTVIAYIEEQINDLDTTVRGSYNAFITIIHTAKSMLDSTDYGDQDVLNYIQESQAYDKFKEFKTKYTLMKLTLTLFNNFLIPKNVGQTFNYTFTIGDKEIPISITATEENIEYFNALREDISKLLAAMTDIEKDLDTIETYLSEINVSNVAENISGILALLEKTELVKVEIYDEIITNVKGIYNSAKEYLSPMIDTILNELASKRQELEKGKKELSDGWKEYYSKAEELKNGRAQIANGFSEYYSGKNKLSKSEIELKDAENTLVSKEKDYKDGVKKVNDGQKEYDENKISRDKLAEKLAEIEKYDATIVKANSNLSLLVYKTESTLCDKIKYIVALLFILVGLLVCYSAVSRLIHDHIIRIGTKKALGLSVKEITLSYLVYTVSAAVIGCICSILLGRIIAGIVLKILVKDSLPQCLGVKANFGMLFIMWAIELVLVILTTILSCRRILKERALILLQGPKPPEGKAHFYEKWKLWKKLPLLTKTIINNAFNDKRRVSSTLIGMASCTTLIVMALTISTNINTGYKIQSRDLYKFNTVVYFDTENEAASDNVKEIIEKYGYSNLESWVGFVQIDVPDNFYSGKVIVPSDTGAYKNFSIMKPFAKTKGDMYSGDIYMCSAFGSQLMKNGERDFVFTSTTGDEYTVTVDGSFINYSCCGEAVMSPEKYEEIYGKPWKSNCYLVNTGKNDLKQFNSDLFKTDGYLYTEDFFKTMSENYGMLTSITSSIVAIALILSVVMAFLVILNLLFMFLAEKKKELIVLRINGYTVRDAQKYIYSDTIFLTAISIIIGLIVGTFFGNLALMNMASPTIMTYYGISPIACLCGIFGTGLLVLIASVFVLRDIKKFKLTDISK